MVDLADIVLAIWDGRSRGTKYTVDYAVKKGKRIIEVIDK
jgi:nucleoside 2-deoxyribosyltransferase